MSIGKEAEILKHQLEEENNHPVRIALFGQPGAGKSSIINKLVGEKIAETGVRTDCTVEAQIIKWNEMILVDLPGYGTSKFPPNKYFNKFDILNYDLFLCVFSGKFHESDTKFFKEIKEKGKTALLVRNQSDDIWEEGKSNEELKQEIAKDVQQQIETNAKIHFTSCKTGDGFNDLEEAISNSLNKAKKERWSRSAKAYSIEALKKKKEASTKYVLKKAGLSAANALNPIPGADIAVDVGILLSLFKDIREMYSLTDEKLQNEEIIKNLGAAAQPILKQIVQYSSKEGIMVLLKKYASKTMTKTVAKYIPFVGQAIAASAGFLIVRYAGEKYLDDCHEIAREILKRELGVE